ncbi:MAG: thioesterase family protein [Gammaproteobacteria bacterium]
MKEIPARGLVTTCLTVKPEWLDYNAHMNVAYYNTAFDVAIEDLKAAYGLTPAYREAHGRSTVALECHLTYQNEAHLGDALRIESRILATDGKRTHIAQAMYREATLLATQEVMSISFDLAARRTCPFDPVLLEGIHALQKAQAALPTPGWIGRRIGLDSPRPRP